MSTARRSRNQRSAAVSAGPAAAGRNGAKGWSETGTSGGSDALRLVLRTQPRSEKSSRLATISTDTDSSRRREQHRRRAETGAPYRQSVGRGRKS